MEAILTKRLENVTFRYPAFKFLSGLHADALLQRGSVYVPELSSFRDASVHTGLIHDGSEGQATIVNEYFHYAGLVKNAEGLLPLGAAPYQTVMLTGQTLERHFDLGTMRAYCMTQHFLSDSLGWALNEAGKDTCVLITDPDRFMRIVHVELRRIGLTYGGVHECIYAGDNNHVVRESNPGPSSVTNHLLASPTGLAAVKPSRYSRQREIRALWQVPDPAPPIAPIECPELCELCLPVDFATVDLNLYNAPASRGIPFECRIHRRSTPQPAIFTISQPWEVFSPLVFMRHNNPTWMLGGADIERTAHGNIYAAHADLGAYVAEDGTMITAAIPLADVARLESAFPGAPPAAIPAPVTP